VIKYNIKLTSLRYLCKGNQVTDPKVTVSNFLWVVYCDHASILHCYGDVASQR